jgi:uncharacterized sulfatase
VGAKPSLQRPSGPESSRGTAAETLLVVTSDHGECFGAPPPSAAEPLALEYGLGTHESLFHVPLLVRAPGQRRGRTERSLAGHRGLSAAVDAARSGATVDPGWFVAPDGTVTAHQPPLHRHLVERARRVCRRPDRYEGAATVVYEEAESRIRKRAAYGDGAYGDGAYVVSLAGDGVDACPPERDREEPAAVRAAADRAASVHDTSRDLTRARTDDGSTDTDASLLGRESTDAWTVTERLEDLGYL